MIGIAQCNSMSTVGQAAFFGSLVADALAIPVHWYYDTDALRRDYGELPTFLPPRNPHPDSILWRSSYAARNERGDILREQVQFWGRRGVHYHQFLGAGENTLNFRLAWELVNWCRDRAPATAPGPDPRQPPAVHHGYDPEAWLGRYIKVMLSPGWHRDTYVEEYHRAFFDNFARGKRPSECGIRDGHIGGLAQVPALFHVLEALPLEDIRKLVQRHVSLTHDHPVVLAAADTLVRLLHELAAGATLRKAIEQQAANWLPCGRLERWSLGPDEETVGRRYSRACYIEHAMPASLFLAWKYHDDFAAGIRANALAGGDNCHRGAVVGSLLAAANGIPQDCLRGLRPSDGSS